MARSTQRKKFRAWARARGLDLNGCQETAFKVWLHCRLEEEQKNMATKNIIKDVITELKALKEIGY